MIPIYNQIIGLIKHLKNNDEEKLIKEYQVARSLIVKRVTRLQKKTKM